MIKKERENQRTTFVGKQAAKMLAYFYQSPSRYYRRLFAKYLLNKNLKNIFKYFDDALDIMDDWDPFVDGKRKQSDGGVLSNDDALVMVSGSLKA